MMLRVRFLLIVITALVNRSRSVYLPDVLERSLDNQEEAQEELESRKVYNEALDTKLSTEQYVDLLASKTSVEERGESEEDLVGKELLVASESKYIERPEAQRPGLLPQKEKLHHGCKSVCPAHNGGKTFNCAKYLKDIRYCSWKTRRELSVACFRCQRACARAGSGLDFFG